MQQNYYFIYLRYLDLFRCIERCIEANFVKTDCGICQLCQMWKLCALALLAFNALQVVLFVSGLLSLSYAGCSSVDRSESDDYGDRRQA